MKLFTSPARDADYQTPYPLTAKLHNLTLKIDRPQLTPEQIKTLEDGMKKVEAGKEQFARETRGPPPTRRPATSPANEFLTAGFAVGAPEGRR